LNHNVGKLNTCNDEELGVTLTAGKRDVALGTSNK